MRTRHLLFNLSHLWTGLTAKTFLYSSEICLFIASIHFTQICPLKLLRIGVDHFSLMNVI